MTARKSPIRRTTTSPEDAALAKEFLKGFDPKDFWDNAPDWAYRIWGTQWWSAQRAFWRSIHDNQLTSMKTCNDIGKTTCAPQIAILYSLAHYPSTVVMLSATWDMAKDTLWVRTRNYISTLREMFPSLAEENGESWQPYGPKVDHSIRILSP